MLTFKELRDRLEPSDIIRILEQYNVHPYYQCKNYLIFETCCHNPIGTGSNKLYYYTNTHMFKCYTECDCMFDIFELIIKIENIQGRKIGKGEAIRIAGFDLSVREMNEVASDSLASDLTKLIYINNAGNSEEKELPPINQSFLDERYTFDLQALKTWRDEGISINSMFYYQITYDPIENCIVIPQFDENGAVVGVRGRFLDEEAQDKYKPITYNGVLLNCPTNSVLYGYYQNKKALNMTRTAIIFESEKSVLKMDTIYNKNNISVAVYGQHISKKHIKLLVEAGVSNVIIAFDADYRTEEEAQQKFEQYKKITKPLNAYFNISIIIDFHNRLGYKDSPIDRGETIFNELMKERIYI